MSDGIVLRRSARRRPRTVLTVLLLSLGILVVGWSALWIVARQQAAAGLDGFIASEAAHGRRWSCPSRTIDGYPFRIAVSCRDVGFEGTVDGSPGRGRLAGLTARAWLYEPSAVYLLLDGPMTLTTADHHADFTLGWERLGAKLRGVLGARARAEIVGEALTLARPDGSGGSARRVAVRAGPALASAAAGSTTAGSRAAQSAAADAAATDADSVEMTLSGVDVAGLDAVTGDAAPLDGQFSGLVTHALGDLPDLGPATVERWRAAGGRLDVGDLTLKKGPLSLGASGTLGLDARHRVEGALDARFSGFEPIMKRFGISLGAVQVGGLLANLLGSKPAPAPNPGDVSLPVTFANGSVTVGPFKTGLRLPPLY